MILMKNIIREGHKTLTTVSKNVNLPLTKSDKKLLKEMLEYVINSQDEKLQEKYDLRPAVGLSAPQVNVLKRMFCVHVMDFDQKLYSYSLVNPTVTRETMEIIYVPGGEGCLSVDRETVGLTPRYAKVRVKGLSYDHINDTLTPVDFVVSGYPAIVFQHEYDHLEGILYTTKLFDSLPFAKPAF